MIKKKILFIFLIFFFFNFNKTLLAENNSKIKKPQIVLVGVYINSINYVDLKKGLAEIDFYIWLRTNKNPKIFKSIEITNSSDLVKSFENYIRCYIEYFKMIDKSDSLQNEYIGLHSLEEIFEDDDNEEENIIVSPYQEEIKSLFMNKPTTNTLLDTFVKIKKEENPVSINNIPQQKEINLSDPKFMVKGIIYN